MTEVTDPDTADYESASEAAQQARERIAAPVEGTVIPRQSAGAEVSLLPESLADLADMFREVEPTPREVMGWILGQEEMPETDPEEGARAIVARILSAESADDVLSISSVTHAQEILQVPLEIFRVKWQRGTFEEGTTCYVVLSAVVIETGERVTITCGGTNVMVQLVKMGIIGAFPFKARITKSIKATARGFYPLWLEPV